MPFQKITHLPNLDTAQTVIFSRDLEMILTETYDVQYPELMGRSFIPPLRRQPHTGATQVTFRTFDRVGQAKLIASYARDIPRVDVEGEETTSSIKGLAAGFGWSIQEIRSAQMAGVPLDSMKATAARRAIEELFDILMSVGSTLDGLVGALNHPNVPQASVVTVSGATTFAAKMAANPDLVLFDIADMIEDAKVSTNGVERLTDVAFPIAQYGLLNSTRLLDQNTSVLDYVKKTYPGIRFHEWYRLTGAGSGGTDRMWGWTRRQDKLGYVIPQEFETMEPQIKGFEFEVPCHGRSGGVIVFYPLSMSYRDGI